MFCPSAALVAQQVFFAPQRDSSAVAACNTAQSSLSFSNTCVLHFHSFLHLSLPLRAGTQDAVAQQVFPAPQCRPSTRCLMVVAGKLVTRTLQASV